MKLWTRGSIALALALTWTACAADDGGGAPPPAVASSEDVVERAPEHASALQVCTAGAPQCIGAIANVTACGRPSSGFRCWFESEMPDGSASCSCSANPQ